MSIIYPAFGSAIVLAGGDKLAGDGSYRRMFRGLGWSQNDMRRVALIEVVGGALMIPRATRRLGGALVAVASAVVLQSELRGAQPSLAGPRALVLLTGLGALVAPGRR